MRRGEYVVAFAGAAIASWRVARAKSIKAVGIGLPPTLCVTADEALE